MLPRESKILGTLLALAVIPTAQPATADPPASSSAPAVPDNSLTDLSNTLRAMLVQAMPATLYEASPNWGHTSATPNVIKRLGKNFGARPETYQARHNDGTWRKIRLTSRNLPTSLVVELRDWKYPDPDHMTFTSYIAFDAGVDFEQQVWKAGARLYSGSVRARMRVHLTLQCEVLLRMETDKTIIPDVVFRMRVVKSDLKYDKVVVEHVAGIGGSGARILGDAMYKSLHKWHPSVERNLLDKANAAIVKAADTREVRLGLGSLLNPNKK